jgi:arylsulfatase A-like enzyme
MKQELTKKKILVYSISLYILLFLAEFSTNIFSFIMEYSTRKVGSSLFPKASEIFGLLKFDFILYILTQIIIYLIFSLINYYFVILVYHELSRKRPNLTLSSKVYLFISINIYFILSLYFFNSVFYPNSHIIMSGSLFVSHSNYHVLKVFACFFLLIYFIGLFYFSYKHAKKKEKILIWGFLGLIILAHLNPYHHLKNFYYAFSGKKNVGPNIIIIGLDSLNPEHTGYFGYEFDTTPYLDGLLKETVVFNNSYTPLARTFPSWFSILTGQYPVSNGARYNLIKRKFISQESETLPNILKEKEYFTAYFTDETRFSNILKEDGFQYLRHPIKGVKDFVFGSIHDFSLTNVFFNSPLGYKIFNFLDINRAVYHLYNSSYFTDDLVSFMNYVKKKEKFLLAVHFCAPHWPYISSAPYPYMYKKESNPLFEQYDGALRMADDQLRRLMSSIKKEGLYDNSIIIVLSDHGETLTGHGTDLRVSGQNHILLSFKLPGKNSHFEVNKLVSTTDIFPTILDLLDLNLDEFHYEGSSLKPLLHGEEKDENLNKYIYLETGFSIDVPGGIGVSLQEMIDEGIHFYEWNKRGIITVKEESHEELIKRKQRAIQTEKWKLILTPLVRMNERQVDVSLYDLTNDPECEQDVSEKFPKVYEELLNKLIHHYKGEITEEYLGNTSKDIP